MPPSFLPGRYRWTIVALLFTATTINYMDRSILGVLAPTLQYKVFHWSDQDYAWINISFKVAYALGMLSMGAVIDRLGTRLGYVLSIGLWSVFGMLHAAVRPAFSFVGFVIARFGLGLGESGNFPAANKTVAEWFPRKERALALGLFNAGSNVGAILAPLLIPLIVLPDGTGWQYAFLVTGTFSALWVVWWLRTYRPPEGHPKVSPEERAYILSDSTKVDPSVERIPWRRLLPLRETWAFAVAKLTDAVWWFYLFWTGKYLFDRFGLDIRGIGIPLAIIYVLADVGSVGGGWLSSAFIKAGWTVNRARKTAMLICALFIMPVMFTTQIGTTFVVDTTFFERINAAVGDGAVPQEVQQQVRSLAGNRYASAKEFSAALAERLPAADHSRYETVLLRAGRTDSYYWIAVFLIGFAAAGHQAWSANIFTLVSDVFPKRAVASVTGIGGMVGGVAGIVVDYSLGRVLTSSGPSGYFFAFLVAGSTYLITLGIVHLLMPRMEPLDEQLRHLPA